ncbi:MAG: hypothetical protein IKH92_04285 [Clostridiales bacterium]|nr:hypothetical protein [Clostridiales bacterium]
MRKMISVLVICTLIITISAACGSKKSKAAEKYIGVWYGYKVSTDKNDIVFEDYAALVKMELTAEFTSDGKYTLHYYINGEEGEEYPQKGSYSIEDDKIKLIEDEGVGEIVNGELVISFDGEGGAVRQYFKSNK